MHGKIQKLSSVVIDKIAAGEVVEDPASCVKELIENALDAGALNLTIEIEEGGLRKIVVSDDGSGMNAVDAKLCLQRHATSKIRSAEDLEQLASFGFRGEALASMAAISEMRLVTAEEDAVGTVIEVQGGALMKEAVAARSRGTTVEIRHLFYNTPARKKFQKSARALSAEVSKTVAQLALAHPQVNFTLLQNGQSLIERLPQQALPFAQQLLARAKHLLGADLLEGAHWIEHERGAMKVMGYVATPSKARLNRTGQHIFIHQRVIQAPLISYAVKNALSTMLSEKLHPVFLLHVFLPLNSFDVNVHPQKKEVRFLDEKGVKSFLEEAVRQSFFKREVAQEVPAFMLQEAGFVPQSHNWTQEWIFQETLRPSQQEIMPCAPIFGFWGGRYLFIEQAEHLQVFDATRASAMLLFSPQENRESTPLLLPLVLHLTSFESQKILSHEKELGALGFILRQVDGSGLWCEAHPSALKSEQIKDFLLEFPSKKMIEQKIIVQKKVSQSEAEDILHKVQTQRITLGLDGRPLFATITQELLDVFFKN